ncbi:MAG: ferrous iron transport protein A [Anaerolineae bacterium]|nr:ferrous iron transport protein A [Anaerolineae bacterium]
MTTSLTLAQLSPDQRATIRKIGGDNAFRRRVMDLGLVSGTEVEVVRVAPFGDPVEYKLKGYHLSLRRRDACTILIDLPVTASLSR